MADTSQPVPQMRHLLWRAFPSSVQVLRFEGDFGELVAQQLPKVENEHAIPRCPAPRVDSCFLLGSLEKCDQNHRRDVTVADKVILEFMNWRFKLVALWLAVGLFGSPVFALANCSRKVAKAGHCGEDCPMMMHTRQATTTELSETPSRDGSCCQVSTLPESAIKLALAAQAKTSLQLPTATQAVSAIMPAVPSLVKDVPAKVLSPSPSPQAALCTFLI